MAERLARFVAHEKELVAETTRQLLAGLAHVPALSGNDSKACSDLLGSLIREHPLYANLVVVDPSGNLRCSARPSPGPISYADREWFRAAARTRRFVPGRFVWGRVMRRPIATFAYPVVDGRGRLERILAAAVDLRWLNAFLDRLPLPEGGVAFLVDPRGVVLAGTREARAWTGQDLRSAPLVRGRFTRELSGIVEGTGPDGVLRLAAFAPVLAGGPAGYAVVAIRTSEAYALSRSALRDHLVALGLAVALALAVGWGASRRLIGRHVEAVARAARRISAGDLSARAALVSPLRELEVLGQAFDEMAEAVEQRDREIRRAAEETARRLRQVQALRNIDLAITASLDPRVTMQVLLEQVTAQLGVDAAAVLLLSPDTLELECAAHRGFRTPLLERVRLKVGRCYAGRAALERRIYTFADLPGPEDPLRRRIFEEEGIRAYYAAPMISRGRVLGVLETYHRAEVEADGDWLEMLEALAGQAAIAVDNARLFDDLERSNLQLRMAYEATIEGWARALELRERETGAHTQRVADLTVQVARKLGVPEHEIVHLRRGAILHDIGKIAVPDHILLKPGPLTEEEWAVMRRHPEYAYELLSPIEYLRPALEIPYGHHERWDGSGYPRGLRGEEIPLAARIFAVVDVYDALTSDRPYRRAWSHEQAVAYLREQAGRQFDPRVVEAFLQVLEEGTEKS
ncbi:MAG: HD domain-containing phosphohydrolase [Armatimonadota bacterium]|nr:HD domain-containing phosphohydrolase [Armatimonadota bacterium]MDR7569526.1 HD domain-containing phosphohydrolase [Armatimonadota bacterium]MDR7613558.1 HD domain-containing phosphohydrolase [Armatimonadota bacterium]